LKKNRPLIIILGIVLVTVGLYGSYQHLFAAPKKTADSVPEYKGDAQEFSRLINNDPSNWVNKVVQINGKVTEITDDGILINGTIYCQFDDQNIVRLVYKNESLTIKGKLVGFDELLMEIKLSQCIIP